MNQPSGAEQLRALGYQQGKRNGMRTSPIGAKKRAMVQTEKGFYPTVEKMLLLHGLDFWRCESNQRSQPGFPDYEVYGNGWIAWLELKARSLATGRAGKLSPGQLRYKASIEGGGGEYVARLLPDEWAELEDWLNAHTGKNIRGTWRTA